MSCGAPRGEPRGDVVWSVTEVAHKNQGSIVLQEVLLGHQNHVGWLSTENVVGNQMALKNEVCCLLMGPGCRLTVKLCVSIVEIRRVSE